MARDRNYFTSPQGRAVYPHLSIGDPDTKFDADGVYKTKLQVTGPEAQEFKEAIDEAVEAHRQELLEEEDNFDSGDDVRVPYEEQEDGSILFGPMKMKARGKTREGKPFTREPSLFDSAGNPCPDVEVGGGSVIRVAGEINEYFVNGPVGAGIGLRLNAVQVIELNEWEPDAETFGFDTEEGFTSGDSDESAEDGSAESDEDDSAESAEDFDF